MAQPKIQIAKEYDGFRRDAYTLWASPKLDGVRGFWTAETGLVSRSGKRFKGLEAIEHECEDAAMRYGYTLIDGELYAEGMDCNDITSVVMSGAYTRDKRQISFHIFAVQKAEPYRATNLMIRDLAVSFGGGAYQRLFAVPYEEILNNRKTVTETCEKYAAGGYEGVCLRHPSRAYTHGGYDLMKYKLFKEADLTIVGVIKSSKGEFARALVVEGVVEGEFVVARVSAGLSAFQREQYQLGKETMKGIKAEIQYQEISKGANGIKSLRFPVFRKLKLDR